MPSSSLPIYSAIQNAVFGAWQHKKREEKNGNGNGNGKNKKERKNEYAFQKSSCYTDKFR